ncbi:unnamed protein product [Rotaria sp. Silwood1]|nr:unnamed protein product [Rotaria sp. Silwood1]
MSNSENCPNCDNIYGNEPRKIPCGHIVCHKCCLDLFNKENNTLICPVCGDTHTFKSKNTFKKTLQQVAHSGFGKKTATREISFASTMPVEKASGAEKSANKEVKKAVANLPTAPPGAPPETSPIPPPLPPSQLEPFVVVTKPPLPMPLMPTKPTVMDGVPKVIKQQQQQQQQQQSTSNNTTLPSLLNTIVSAPSPSPSSSVSEAVIARCHSCGNKCQVIVCEHCDHFVCLKCAEEHRTTTKVDAQELINKWHECKNKYNMLLQKLNQYNHDRIQIESDLAAIRVAVEQRSRDAIQYVVDQRDSLISRINEHMEKEQTINNIKHNDLVNEFRQIQNRFESALNGEDIGSYTQGDFLRDIHELQNRMNKRNNLMEKHIFQIPTISRYERISIEKLLGELHFNSHMMTGIPNQNISSLLNNQPWSKQNGLLDYPAKPSTTIMPNTLTRISSPTTTTTSSISPNNHATTTTTTTTTNDITNIKPLMAGTYQNGTIDVFDEFRRMAAQIHQQFNAPYSKVINAASSIPFPISDGIQNIDGTDKNSKRFLTKTKNQNPSTGTFSMQWKTEHTAVPNFLCMTPYPTPKIFILDKYGKVSVCSIPPKPPKPFESYSLFPNGTDELIESAVVSSRFLIVYSRKKQDTMTGTMYFFNHECKSVLQSGIHQSIPVHHILCDQNANRLYCLDRMRCTIYYHTLPNNSNEIETCMKTRRDFIQFNSNYAAFKMLQNDDILGFYERNECTVHLYDKKKTEKIDEFKCEHFTDKFESWGIIAIRKDNNSLIFKVDERDDHDAANRQHIVYEVNRSTKQIISHIQLNSVFGMIIGPNNEVILGIRQTKDSGVIQCYIRKRIHQFESFSHFEMSLIVDAFVMSLVMEHRRKTTIQSTPLLAFTLEEILERSPAPFLIAKCAECTLRKELVVCPECEQVICFECISQHQLVVNNRVQQNWMTCKDMWNTIYEKSMLFDEQQFNLKSYTDELKSRIEKRSNFLFETIEKWRNIYDNKINQYSEVSNIIRQEITTQYQLINQHIQIFLNTKDPDPIKAEHFLQEIKDFKIKLRRQIKQIDEYSHKLPTYSILNFDSSILGTLSMQTSMDNLKTIVDDNNNEYHIEIENDINDNESTSSNESQETIHENSNIQEVQESNSQSPLTTLENIPNKKLLWSLHFKFVPQYIALYRQSILFASDRWGFVSTWTYTNARTKPTPKKTFVLFPQFRVGTWSRVYVESFSVYKPYICVFVKGSDESLANFIAFFTHSGQLQMKVEYDHRYTLRQLICDESSKGNCIWAVDRGMHCIYKHDLPRVNKEIKPFLSTHKIATHLNDRSCDVIRMAINQNILALLDSRTQIVTFYDKSTQKEIGIYSAECLPTGENKLWRVEIFPDNSLLLRFDDDERTGDRSQVIHHIVVHVKKNEANKKYEAISQIQATNVYGFAIGSDSEVIVGLRKSNCFEGLINCYV